MDLTIKVADLDEFKATAKAMSAWLAWLADRETVAPEEMSLAKSIGDFLGVELTNVSSHS